MTMHEALPSENGHHCTGCGACVETSLTRKGERLAEIRATAERISVTRAEGRALALWRARVFGEGAPV